MKSALLLFRKAALTTVAISFTAVMPAFAQQTIEKLQRDNKIADYEWSDKRGSLQSVTFRPGAGYAAAAADTILQSFFELKGGIDAYALKSTTTVDEQVSVLRYQQIFKGLRVALGTVAVISQNGIMAYIKAEHYPIAKTTGIVPSLPESAALAQALAYVHATKYMWQEAGVDPEAEAGGYPKGELVLINDFFGGQGVKLAYHFDIYATEPLSRSDVYVSATNGAVLFSDAILKDANANATAVTKYSGPKTIITDNTGSGYRLRETLPTMMGIKTLNLQKGTTYTAAVDLTDADNNWTAAEYNNANLDDAMLDAHWGAEQVYSYWKAVRGRNSYDNSGGKILSYVHYSTAYNNAFWNGNYMTYGDGSYTTNGTGFKALTSLDVCGHELAHGVCQYTAGLSYSGESGALNEGFSDIWGACVEHNVDPTNSVYETFLIGEQLYASWVKGANRNALRDMANPRARSQPDTYGGTYWVTTVSCTPTSGNDYCGVHTNSGLLNKWFYLLTVGGSGTNGLNNAYSVNAIGWDKSQKLTYLTELSLNSSSDYTATRSASIAAAATLYGACSPEAIAVTNAWYAVGVGTAYSSSCAPEVHFAGTSGTISEGVAATTCHPSKTITATIRLDGVATQPATITLVTGGTATQGVDYDISPASFTFAAGSSASQDVTITVYDDAIIEGTETITLGYTLNAGGGTATTASTAQVYTLSIIDDDVAPVFGTTTSSVVTLINENFGTSGGALPPGWSAVLSAGNANTWVVGANGGAGTGQGAYITSNTSTKPLDYATTASVDASLRTPLINAAGDSSMTLSFNYKCNGEWDAQQDYDFGMVEYSFDGVTWLHLPDVLKGVSTATAFSTALPDSIFANKSFYIGFRWVNDWAAGNNAPFSIDNVLLSGTNTIRKMAVETQSAASRNEFIPASSAVNVYSAQRGNMLAAISGASVQKGCMAIALTGTGAGQTSITTTGGTILRTQKVFQVSPGTPDATTTYQITLYFTPAELAVWGANKLNLKFLKVADGVSLTGTTISSSNGVIVTPTSVNDQTANGYIAYTGSFTGFSQFMLVSPGAVPLPVNLLYITATARDRQIAVDWATATEQDSKGFAVERSMDGVGFQSIGWVAGPGKSSTEQRYSYADKAVAAGQLYYYRVRQVDLNGQETLSPIRSARLGSTGTGSMELSPNPASTTIHLIFRQPGEGGSIQLRNMQGVTVRSFTVASLASPVDVDISSLPAGVYMVSVHTDTEVWTEKFAKQ